MNIAQVLERLRNDSRFCSHLTAWEVLPARPAQTAPFPDFLDPRLVEALRGRGITQLYTHQRDAVEAVARGENICVVTPTASGKTLCYNIPVLQRLLENPNARALYLFPTKALSQDQTNELTTLIPELGVKIGTYTFDGDTPASARRAIRNAGHIVVTNPDMLHTGILPHHTLWLRFFENLQFVVIDEIHHYRGVFGSHLANVLRRLRRLTAFYGSSPQYICCSATIANPQEMAERLVEQPITLIDNNGAPSGEKHFLFFNPPIVNAELGIRRSSVKEAARIASSLLSKQIQSIVFARSRLRVEVLATYLREAARRLGLPEGSVQSYRGGYLPNERRAIEKGIRDGDVLCVVSTNALELGIDIGSLDACILAGYPGNIASTWQQAGRAGRRQNVALVVLVASSAPLDQYIVQHADYFFAQHPEYASVDPNNLIIMTSHIKCAAFELPFVEGEGFGTVDSDTTAKILDCLADLQVLRKVRNKWHWSAESYPAEEISLRTAAPGNVVIIDVSAKGQVIGEVDYFSAPAMVHENAIYLHQGRQYTIETLDLEDRKAYARPVTVEYYTDAQIKVDIKTLETLESQTISENAAKHYGEVSVTWLPSIYKKIRLGTHENVGWGEIHLPEQTMHTSAYWVTVPSDTWQHLALTRESFSEALLALANTLRHVAPLLVLCDVNDIRTHAVLRDPVTEQPTLYIYETYPGGVGLSEKLYVQHIPLFESALALIEACPCREGCPSCVGPVLEVGAHGKEGALRLAAFVLGRPVPSVPGNVPQLPGPEEEADSEVLTLAGVPELD